MRLAALIPLLCSALSFAVAAYFFLQGNWQSPAMASAYGTVISKSLVDGKSASLIRFTTESGQQVTFQSQSDLAPYYDEGETVHVLYNPSQPESSARDASNSLLKDKTLPMLLALIACALGLIVFMKTGHTAEAGSIALGRLLIAGLGIVFISSGAYGLYQTYQGKSALLNAQGHVVDVLAVQSNPNQPGNYDRNEVLHYPIIKFTTSIGQHFTIKSDMGYPVSPYKTGDIAPVVYDANAPDRATLQGSVASYMLQLALLVLGAICLVLSIRFLK